MPAKKRAGKGRASSDPRIFISHIVLESEMANLLRDSITRALGDKHKIFISGTFASLAPGDVWLSKLTAALRAVDVVLVLCSKISVHSPWVLFETGNAASRKIKIIPVCTGGQSAGGLQAPLSQFQAVEVSVSGEATALMDSLAQTLKCKLLPRFREEQMLEGIRAEEEYAALRVKSLQALALRKSVAQRTARQLGKIFREGDAEIEAQLEYLAKKRYLKRAGKGLAGARQYSFTPKGRRLLTWMELGGHKAFPEPEPAKRKQRGRGRARRAAHA